MTKSVTKRRAARRGSTTGKREAPSTVSEYVARVPAPARRVFKQMRESIRSVVPPDAREVISYGIPAFRRRRVLVWYAAFTDHVSLFPGGSILGKFTDELGGFRTSKGTVQFPLDRPLPIPLIKKIVKARINQAEPGRA